MRLTTKGEYGLLAMVEIARQPRDRFVPISEIAGRRRIPRKYLEQILLALKRSRVLASRKGQQGGYRLARPARQIALADIIRVLDGHLAPTESVSRYFYAPTPIEGERSLIRVFRGIRDHAVKILESTSLADVAR